MSLAYADIADAVLLTQENLIKRGSFVDMQTDLTDYVAVREIWKNRQKKFGGGHPWSWQVQYDHNYTAKAVGLYETDSSAFTDTMLTAEVTPRHVNAHYIYDLREKAFQQGPEKIVDLVFTRYNAMMVSFYEYLESVLWSKPASSADTTTPFGLEYWIVRNATEGFNGENPSGFSSGRAGIDSTVYTRWANWGGTYSEISEEDLVFKMGTMHRKTKFRSVLSHAHPDLAAPANGIYVNSDTLGYFEIFVKGQNMNLGTDLSYRDGRVTFKGTPLTYAPHEDEDTTNPIWMIDWSSIAVGVLEGWENNLTKPYRIYDKHNVERVDLDCTLQVVCTDLRKNGILYQS